MEFPQEQRPERSWPVDAIHTVCYAGLGVAALITAGELYSVTESIFDNRADLLENMGSMLLGGVITACAVDALYMLRDKTTPPGRE